MDWLRLGSLAVLISSLTWWALFPARIDGRDFAALERPPARRAPDPADRLRTRLALSQSLGLFPQAKASEPGVSEAGAAPLALKGTASSPGRRAALISAGGAKPQWVAVGDLIGDLELLEVRGDSAVLRDGSGNLVTLQLFAPAARDPSQVQQEVAHGPN